MAVATYLTAVKFMNHPILCSSTSDGCRLAAKNETIVKTPKTLPALQHFEWTCKFSQFTYLTSSPHLML